MKNAARFLSVVMLALPVVCAGADNRLQLPGRSTSSQAKPATPAVMANKPITPPCGFEISQPGLQPTYQRPPGSKEQPTLKASNMIGAIGDTVPLKAKLSLKGLAVPNHTLRFSVNGAPVGNARTNNQGEARVMYKVPNQMGPKTIQVRYNGTPQCHSVQATANFGTLKSSTRVFLEPPTGKVKAGSKLYMQGTLKRITDQLGLDGREISLSINGKPIGKVTAVNGHFSVNYNVPAGAKGTLVVEASFAGDPLYAGYLARRHVNILPPLAKVYLFWNKAEGRIGQTITLTGCLGKSATLPCGIPVAGQKVRFWADRGTRWHHTIRVAPFQLGNGYTGNNGQVKVQWKVELTNQQLSPNTPIHQPYTLSAHADVDRDRYILEKKSDPLLKVLKSPSSISVSAPASTQIGKSITIVIKLRRTTDNRGIKGAIINGPFGSMTTNDFGTAAGTFTVSSQLGTGSKSLLFKFNGDQRYEASQKSHTIQISPSTN